MYLYKRLSLYTILATLILCTALLAVAGVTAAASTAESSPSADGPSAEVTAPRGVIAGGGRRAQIDPFKSWEFERFDSDIEVHGDGSFTVRETQVVNFTGSFSFLTRDITTQTAVFKQGRTYGKVRVVDVEVFNLDGTPYDGSLWEADSYAGGMLIRINFQARDEQRGWIISYRVKGAIIYAEDYDRLYWNAIPLDREADIRSSRITVKPPEGTDINEVRYTDYYTTPFPPVS